MPVPKPMKNETQDKFISRCISALHRTDPDREHDQIVAICFDTWRNREQIGDVDAPAPSKWASDAENMHADFLWVLKKYIRQWGEEGVKKFYAWVERAKVNITRPYLISTQRVQECLGGICEAFHWVEPLITYYKEDDSATYWKALALTANVSMNRNDYENAYELAKASSSMRNKPLNWNHSHEMWLPFPEARVDLASFEDNGLECIIKIPNDLKHYEENKLVNDMIRDGEIIHVSVEGDPHGSVETEQGVAPLDYTFTALALLENDKTLPGDPLTMLEPLFLRESMGRSLVESLKEDNERKEVKKISDEIFEEDSEELGEAKWSRKYINDLPNGAFAVVEGCADENKSARHLPYKNEEGQVDLPHLRNALARMNQIKSVCGGSDEALRAKAKRKLIPLAKKHLPDSQWAKETLEEGIQGMDVCAQCKSFRDLDNAVVTTPALTGAEDSREVIRISGAIGPGVGFCEVAKQLVRKNDAACTDGRPRSEATDLDRIVEEKEGEDMDTVEAETVNELVLKSQVSDLQADLLKERLAHNEDIELLNENAKEQVVTRDQLARKTKECTVVTIDRDRLKKERNELYEELDREKQARGQADIRADSLEKDVDFYKDENKRLNEMLDKVKAARIVAENEANKALTQANEASAKFATERQHKINADADRGRAIREVASLTEQLANLTREISDGNQIRSEQAKRNLKDQQLINELRETSENKTREIRDLKQKLETARKRLPKKITVRT